MAAQFGTVTAGGNAAALLVGLLLSPLALWWAGFV